MSYQDFSDVNYSKPKLSKWIEKRIPKAASLSLKQNQVFILPSLAGLAFLMMLGGLLVAAINFQNSLIYAVTFLLFSLFVINIIQTWRNLAGIHVSANGVKPIFLGEHAHFNLMIEGHKKAHYYIRVITEYSSDQGSSDVLSPTNLTLIYESEIRGYLHLPRFKIESRYPLGLAVAWSYIDLDQKTLVYPYPIENKWLDSNQNNDVESDNEVVLSTKAGVDDFMGLKPYAMGDGVNRIAWKALSKGQGLLTKHFNAQSGTDTWLKLNHFEGSIEYRLSCMSYWVLQFHETQRAFGLDLGHIIIQPSVGEAHKNAVLRALALYGTSYV